MIDSRYKGEAGQEYSPPKEHQINGTRHTANISGTFNFDWNAYSQFVLTPTGAVTLGNDNLPTGTNSKEIKGIIKAGSVVTKPANWVATADSDAFDNTLDNHFRAWVSGVNVVTFTNKNKAVSGGGTGNNIGWVNVLDHGADPTGATDNTPAFNSAQNAIVGDAGYIYIPEGDYLFSTQFNITKRLKFIGEGFGKNYGWFSASKIIGKTNISLWKISSAGVSISDIGFEWHGPANPTSARAIHVLNTDTDTSPNMPVDKSQSLILRDISVRGFYDNIYIEACSTWVYDNVFNVAPIRYGIQIENTMLQDAGDWCISNSMFFQPMATPGGYGVYQTGSGGGKIVNTKFNGAFNYCYWVQVVGTSIILFSNSSFENFVFEAIHAQSMAMVSVVGCQIAPYRMISGDAMLNFVNISGGVISSNNFRDFNNNAQLAIKVSNSNDINVSGNSYYEFTTFNPVLYLSNINLRDDKSNEPISRNGNFTVSALDYKKDNNCTTGLTVTVPNNSSVPIQTGFESNYWQIGTGAVTFTGASGVTIYTDISELKEISSQYNAVTLKKIGTNEWVLIGALKKY